MFYLHCQHCLIISGQFIPCINPERFKGVFLSSDDGTGHWVWCTARNAGKQLSSEQLVLSPALSNVPGNQRVNCLVLKKFTLMPQLL